MQFQISALAIAAALLVTACGGGGGGGTTSAPVVTTPLTVVPTSAAVAVTSANAKFLASAAQQAATSPISMGTLSIFLGNGTFTGSQLNLVRPCANLGTALVSGTLANLAGLTTGDRLAASFNNCTLAQVVGVNSSMTLHGNTSTAVTSGAVGGFPSFVSANTVIDNLSFEVAGLTQILSGAQTFEWTVTNLSQQTMVVAGTTLTLRNSSAGTTRTSTWQNYRHVLNVDATGFNYSVTASVQTDNTNFGPTGGSYTLSTITPLALNQATSAFSSGELRVTGAANSSMRIILSANNAVTLQIDTNGDGVIDSTVNSTITELVSLR